MRMKIVYLPYNGKLIKQKKFLSAIPFMAIALSFSNVYLKLESNYGLDASIIQNEFIVMKSSVCTILIR